MSLSLEEQLEAHWKGFADALHDLRERLCDGEYISHLYFLSRERLREGHKEFGDLMFRGDSGERSINLDQELADSVNYSISGPLVPLRKDRPDLPEKSPQNQHDV